jgi:hypothetical protein
MSGAAPKTIQDKIRHPGSSRTFTILVIAVADEKAILDVQS